MWHWYQVCVCRNCTFLEIKLRAWAYLTSMLLVLAASSLRIEYMSEIASRPDRWRSSEYNEYLDICISLSASSTSLWATVSENLSLAKACDKQATSWSGDTLHVSLENQTITQLKFTYNRNAEYAEECPDSCVGGWCIWLGFLLADAGICSCDVFLELSRNRRNDSSRSRYVGSVIRSRLLTWKLWAKIVNHLLLSVSLYFFWILPHCFLTVILSVGSAATKYLRKRNNEIKTLNVTQLQEYCTCLRTDGSSGVKPSAGDSRFWCTWTTCLAISRSVSMSARSRINQRRSKRDRSAGGRFMFSAGVLLMSYLPLNN